MNPQWRIVLVFIFLLSSGCAALPLATVGVMADIAGVAVSSGPTVYHAGKLDIAFMADDISVRRAVRAAAVDLDLHVTRDQSHDGNQDKGTWDFRLRDDRQTDIDVTVEQRTPNLCWCRVDVGLFGSEPMARLIMARIHAHVPPQAAATEGSI
jgi:hypothetical protein